jgi:O-antigen ligase
MVGRTLSTPAATRALVTLAAFAVAAIAGTLLVYDPKLGLTFVGGLVFVPAAFISPPLALTGWLVSAFLTGLPGIGAAANRALLVVFVVWIGTLAATRTGRFAARQRMPQLGLVIAFFVWIALTLIWAPQADKATELIFRFAMAGLVYLMVITFVTEARYARWFAAAFVAGCVLSILAGVAMGGLEPGGGSVAADEGRLQGGAGDPNYLAAAIVPAMMLAAALTVRRGRLFIRLGLIGALVVLAIGLAATESRGGFLAVLLVSAGALLFWRGKRLRIAALIVVFALAAASWFAISPTAWDRVTASDATGSGRTDIWTVAWRVVEDHPVDGVGLNQFPLVSPQYINEPGALRRADLIVDQQILVHNAYLQLWAETGIIGLTLFLAIALRAVLAGRKAALLFEARGDPAMATLARAAMLGVIGLLAASFFLSNIADQRLWALLAFCSALLLIAKRAETPGEARAARAREEFAR